MTLTAERARELFSYDAETGELCRRHGMYAGPVGTDVRGYGRVKIDGTAYPAHRVVWLIQTGNWPAGMIDHINRNRSDNRFCNLRDVDRSVNAQNAMPSCASGFRGVFKTHNRKGWSYQIRNRRAGVHRYKHGFATAEDAARAYDAAALLIHGAGATTNAALGLLPSTGSAA